MNRGPFINDSYDEDESIEIPQRVYPLDKGAAVKRDHATARKIKIGAKTEFKIGFTEQLDDEYKIKQ